MKKLLFCMFLALVLISCEKEIPIYVVTVSSTPSEGGLVSPQGGEYQEGQTATFTATPNEFYGFVGWSGADTSTINPISIIVDTNKSLTARFEKLDTDNDGVTDDVDQCPDTPSNEQADSNGCSVSQKEFELTITTEGEGTVTEQVVVAPSIYQGTTQVQITAVPAEGWELSEWTGDLTGNENPVTIEIDGTKNITAVFTKKDTDGDGVPDLDDLCEDTPEGSTVNRNGCHDFIYIDENGVTIKARETALFGDTQEINGKIYKVVNDALLEQMIANDEDVSIAVTTYITSLSELFKDNESFNQDISSWDTSNVVNMEYLFLSANSFNQDISYWDVSKVESMRSMFNSATVFNQDISNWDVGNVQNMRAMFAGSFSEVAFNQDLSSWDVSSVKNMNLMFYRASSFNSDISLWDVSSVETTSGMFAESVFNQPIGNWDVSNVGNMSYMFDSSVFNQDISSWDVTSVGTFRGMFWLATEFNQNISAWDVSNAGDMQEMFSAFYDGITYEMSFNQDLSGWDVSNVSLCNDFINENITWKLPKPRFTNCSPGFSDGDGDGIIDSLDECPNSPEGAQVDDNGCVDSNGNGIPDNQEGDADNDGVIDYFDECPETPSETPVNDSGCAVIELVFLDSDGTSWANIGGNVTGNLTFSIKNNLDEPIQLESLRVYDTATNELRIEGTRANSPEQFPILFPTQTHTLSGVLTTAAYRPLYIWSFTYKGETYEASKYWQGKLGFSREANQKNNAKGASWDGKITSFSNTTID